MKAILITEENRELLATRFAPEEDDVLAGCVGKYLVAPFRSEDGPYEIVNTFNLHRAFENVGTLENDWFEVRPKK